MSWLLEPTFVLWSGIASLLLGMASALYNRSALMLMVMVAVNVVAIGIAGALRHEPWTAVVPAEVVGFVIVQIGYFTALLFMRKMPSKSTLRVDRKKVKRPIL